VHDGELAGAGQDGELAGAAQVGVVETEEAEAEGETGEDAKGDT